jgi:hypothetical protein
MGVAQILLDNLDLSALVIGWYKLFGTSSLVSVPPGGGKADAQVKNPVKSFKWKNDKTNYIQPAM